MKSRDDGECELKGWKEKGGSYARMETVERRKSEVVKEVKGEIIY